MEKKVPLFYEGNSVGYIEIIQNINKLTFFAECSEMNAGVFRAYACSSHDPSAKIAVGVMMPDKENISARKTYTNNDLRNIGISFDTIDTGALVLYNSFTESADKIKWNKCACPQKVFDDSALQASLRDCFSAVINEADTVKYIAVPIRKDEKFGFAPAFCLVNVIKIKGEKYGVLGIGDDGIPIKAVFK